MEDTRIAAIDEERIGELKVAEYLIFLFALDTYMRYLEEIRSLKVNTDVDPDDAVLKQGLSLLRMADREHLEIVKNEISASVTVPASLSMLEIAVSLPPTPKGAALRALKLRTVLSRGGTATSKAIFGKSTKARTEIREALDAAMLEDADAALAKLAMIDIRNTRLERWIDLASETAQPLPVADINPVTAATKVVTDSTQTLLEVGLARDGSTAASEASAIHTKAQADTLRQIEAEAQKAAAKGIDKSGETDAPVTRSEAIAIATTVAAAQKADTTDIRNIPPEFINGGYPLDPEQMAAALTDGRVLVAAGAGAGKCIRGDTLVRTASGMVPIEELAAGLLPDQSADRQETILGLGGPENTSTVLNNGHRMTLILTTRLGYRLEGTLVHPLLVLRDMQLQWVTLGELTLDDVICIDRRPGMFAEAPYRVPPRVFRKVTNARPTQLPEELTPKVASLLGYTVSEGQVVYGQHSTVNLSTTDPLQRDLYEAALDGHVDAWATAPIKTGWRTSFHGRANLEALADFGMTFTKAEEKEIPSGVLRSPRPVVVSFLRALFDGDGGFCRHEVYYDSASEKLARQVQELLLSFGIVSRLRFKPNSKKGCWNVSLTGDDARLYLREIGFNLVAKQQAAEEALMDKESNPNLDVIPGVAGLFRAVLSHARSQGVHVSKHAKHDVFKGYANGSRCPSYRMLHEFLDAYPGDTDAHQTLRTLADAHWFFDTIDSLKESEADVYDFVVPGTHAFSAGGFVNHNSTTLVSRIAYLVKSKGVKPARIFACSFNTKAANELGTKVAGKVGEAARDQMSIGTMNALFARFIRGDVRRGIPAFGSAEERDLFTDARLIADPEPPKTTKVGPKPINMTKAIQGIFKQCASALPAYTGWPKEWFDDIPKAKKCNLFVSVWKGNDVDYKQARANARSKAEKIASLWYEFYLGLKGDLPGWHPPCRVCKSFDNWMKDYRPGGERLGDLDDQIRILRDILRRDPVARKKIQSMFDHILVDEAQDRNLLNSEVFDLMSEHITDGADGKSLWIVGDDKQAIYQFRGARPEIFSGLHDKEGWTTRMIRTNYRCAPEIVEAANRLSANNTNQIPMEAQANPDKPRGRSSIVVDVPEDHATGAARTISRIMKETTEPPLGQGHNRDEYAVLSRTNRELDDFETACCIAEMPYARTGGRGLFDSPESKTVLGYIDLAYGVNYEKTAKSLADALMKPDRGLFLSAAKIAQIVEETLGDVARMEGRSVRDINPLDLVMKERYARELAIALKTPYRAKIPAFVFDKTVNQLTRSLLDMGSQVSKIRNTLAEGKQAADVIETILDGVSATVTMWDKDLRREVSTTKTLRQQITEDLAVFGDDDEEEAEETVAAPEVTPEGDLVPAVKAENPAKGLGAVQFLYLLNEQNNTDIQEGTDPTTAAGFLKKLTRIRNNSDKLRVDLGKWAKTQASLPPEQRQKRPDCIILSTVHSVKGAEWRDVTVVMAPGKFPIELKPSKDEAPPTPEESEAHLQAERNLGYVALTRAAESLTVLCPPQGKNVGLSRFVVEAGLTVGQNVEIPEGTEEISKTASTWVDHGLDVEYISNLADTTASYSR